MEKIHFYKFDGAGNDFVIIDARHNSMQLSVDQIANVCHRRLGVGADGLMTLGPNPDGYDFEMQYFNSDGRPASMCGNGARCISVFAYLLGLGRKDGTLRFMASDGAHDAVIQSWDDVLRQGVVMLGMRSVSDTEITHVLDGTLLNTGVPHYVQKVVNLDTFDVVAEGRRLRYHPDLGPDGANVNFVEIAPDGVLHIRTYERGVEDETWACGTGVTASAIATGVGRIKAQGGDFEVTYLHENDCYHNIVLTGPVSLNFEGDIIL